MIKRTLKLIIAEPHNIVERSLREKLNQLDKFQCWFFKTLFYLPCVKCVLVPTQ